MKSISIAIGLALCCCLPGAPRCPADESGRQPTKNWKGEFRSLGSWWRYQSVLGTSPDGKQLMLGSNGHHLAFYDLTLGRVTRMLVTREGMQDAALSPNGRLLAVAEWRDGFTLRDARTFGVLKTFSGTGGLGAWNVRFSRDGTRLLCYSWSFNASTRVADKQYFAYDLASDQQNEWAVYQQADTAESYIRERIGKTTNHLFCVQHNMDQGRPSGFRVWVTDPRSGQHGKKIELSGMDFHQFDLGPFGRRAIVQQPGEPARVIDMQDGHTMITLPGSVWANGAAFSHDGNYIALVQGVKTRGLIVTDKRPPRNRATHIRLYNSRTGQELARLDHPTIKRDYYHVGFSNNDQYIYSITSERNKRREVVLWGNLPEIPQNIDPLPEFAGAKTPDRPRQGALRLRPAGGWSPAMLNSRE